MIIQDYSWVPSKCKELASRYGDNPKELDKALAEFVCDELLPTIKPLYKPDPPELVQRYRAMSELDKKKWDKDHSDWRMADSVRKWADETSRIEMENGSNTYWLKTWMSLVDKDRASKYAVKLEDFGSPSVNDRPKPTERVEGSTQAVLDMFGGSVIDG